MRRFILLCLFFIGLVTVVFRFLNVQGLATKGEFETILLDFREDIPASVINQDLQAIARQYHIAPRLDNQFSAADHVYIIITGDRQGLQDLRESPFADATEFIEPNYIYKKVLDGKTTALGEQFPPQNNQSPKPSLIGPNDQYYSKQWNLHKIAIEGAWTRTKGSGITVAVIDTGITQVRDLAEAKLVKG